MTFANKLRSIMKVNLQEDETVQEIPPQERMGYYAIEARTDFEGNSIPGRYRPVYIVKYGEGDYDFTKRLIPGRSLFDKKFEPSDIAELKQYAPDLQVLPKYDVEAEQSKSISDDKIIGDDEKADKHGKDDLVKRKEKMPGVLHQTSHVMGSATYVDPREIEAFAKNGIHPELAYASNPKPGWWYEDANGEKHLVRIYGITDEKYAGEPSILLREVLPFKLTDGGYLRQMESDGFLMPVSQFKEIIHNPMNAETYEEVMKDIPEEEREDQEVWMNDIARQKQVMQDRFTNWKEKNNFKYDLDQYTKQSLLNVYYANEGKHYPLEKALQMYGKKQADIQNAKAKTMFDAWYDSNAEAYGLDRFDQETLENIFTDVKANNMSIEDAIMQNVELNFEDDIEESVLQEKDAGEIDDNSKEWIVRDPNLLRAVLPNLNISPVYISNPFKVAYNPWSKGNTPDDLDELDKRYTIYGVRKASPTQQIKDIDPAEVKILYIRDVDRPHAKPEAISYKDLRRILNAPENDNPVPTLWDRYRTYKDQKRPLNKGSHYKWVNIDDSVVEQMLDAMQEVPEFEGIDLIGLYRKAQKDHTENKYVSRAMRDFDKEVSFRARIPGDFRGYQFAIDLRSADPTKSKNKGMNDNPYKVMMNMKAN